ncbi:MAG: hypothetical protein ACI8PZ_001598 [Myxococcota bacterium]|jgi:hypothetical protein
MVETPLQRFASLVPFPHQPAEACRLKDDSRRWTECRGCCCHNRCQLALVSLRACPPRRCPSPDSTSRTLQRLPIELSCEQLGTPITRYPRLRSPGTRTAFCRHFVPKHSIPTHRASPGVGLCRLASDVPACVHSHDPREGRFGQRMPIPWSRSVLVVSLHLDGFLHTRVPEVLHSSTGRGSPRFTATPAPSDRSPQTPEDHRLPHVLTFRARLLLATQSSPRRPLLIDSAEPHLCASAALLRFREPGLTVHLHGLTASERLSKLPATPGLYSINEVGLPTPR